MFPNNSVGVAQSFWIETSHNPKFSFIASKYDFTKFSLDHIKREIVSKAN